MLAETYTRTVQPYAYGTEKHTIRVWYVPYACGMYHTRMGTQQNHVSFVTDTFVEKKNGYGRKE